MSEIEALASLQQEYCFAFDFFRAEISTIRIMADLEFIAVGMDGLPAPCTTFYFEVHHRAGRRPVVFFPSDSHVPEALETFLKRRRHRRSGFAQPPGVRRLLGFDMFSRSMTFPPPSESLAPAADQVRAVLEAAMVRRRARSSTQAEVEPEVAQHRPKFRLVEPPRRKKFAIKSIEGEVSETPVGYLDPRQYRVISTRRTGSGQASKVAFDMLAWEEIDRHIGWGQRTRANIVEQGGVYVGTPCILPGGERCGHVKSAIPAPDTIGTSTYVEFSHDTWAYFLQIIQSRKASGEYEPSDVILGWYHTHPNSLDVFMSGTDAATQRAQFYRMWNSAVVINPHRKLIAGFYGGNVEPAEVLLLEGGLAPSAD